MILENKHNKSIRIMANKLFNTFNNLIVNWLAINFKTILQVSFVQGNIKNGLRCSSEKTYLRPVKHRKNLKVLVKSRVTKILIDPQKKEATGVEFAR